MVKKGTAENSGRPRATSDTSRFSGIEEMFETSAGHAPNAPKKMARPPGDGFATTIVGEGTDGEARRVEATGGRIAARSPPSTSSTRNTHNPDQRGENAMQADTVATPPSDHLFVTIPAFSVQDEA